ncbi:MAG: hypothetical protein GY749_49145 [Desulfobacteraceae bacterium]|nr:hypothetical protein [Desulfobacteraceae bacterium]
MEKLKGKALLIAAIMAVSIISLSFSASAQSPVKITEHRYGNHEFFSDEKYNDEYGYTPDDSAYIYMTTCPEESYSNCTYKTPDEICQEEFGSNYHFCSKDEITDNGYSIDANPVPPGYVDRAVLVDDDTYNCDNWNLWNLGYNKRNYYYLTDMPNHNNGWYRGLCNYWASAIACCPESTCSDCPAKEDNRGKVVHRQAESYSCHKDEANVQRCWRCAAKTCNGDYGDCYCNVWEVYDPSI